MTARAVKRRPIKKRFPKRHRQIHARAGTNPFRAPAGWLLERFGQRLVKGRAGRMHDELMELSSGDERAVRTYEVHLLAAAMLLAASALVAAVAAAVWMNLSLAKTLHQIERPDYQMADAHEQLLVSAEGESEEVIDVTVQSRRYTAAEVNTILQEAQTELEALILGANETADEVRSALSFPASLSEGRVSAEYSCEPYGMIAEDGTIIGEPAEEGEIITITALLRCQDRRRTMELAVRVCPQTLSPAQQFLQKIRDALEEADEEEAEQSMLSLPSEVDGRSITWSRGDEGQSALVLLLIGLIPVLIVALKVRKVHEQVQERRQQLQMDYSEVLWKLSLMIGAGQTIRGSFERMADQYRRSRRTGRRAVYEEMIRTCTQMNSGVPEGQAYENFGRRCALPCYVRLGGLLAQNLRKGTRGLAQELEKESLSAAQERGTLIRRMGETASLKLLLPMILMLCIVIVILIVPAFMTMQ